MAISGFSWNGPRGFDIHLLRNNVAAPLLNQLVVLWDGRAPFLGNQIPADITTLTVQFQALFAGAPNAFGARLFPNGVVGALASPPGVQLRNFLVDAIATDSGPGGKTLHQKIRVHLHTSFKNIWLAPNPLTVHQGAQNVRLSVLARFDDDVIGDITDMARLTWASQSPDNVAVDASSGILDAKVVGTNAVIELRRPGGAAASPPDATATVNCVDPWTAPVNVNFVAGQAYIPDLAPVPNILFLADGFDGNSTAFDQLVRATVQQLRTSPSTRPYDLFGDQVNYWSAFTPSREGGIGVAPELVTAQRAGSLKGVEVPLPVDPASRNPPPGQPWTLAELIHQVGLPVPADDPPGRPLEGAGGKLADWQTLYGPQITKDRVTYYNQPDPDIGLSWLDLASRTLANDRDTVFHIHLGERPRVEQSKEFRDPEFNPRRISSVGNAVADDFNSFLKNLQYEGTTIGTRWADKGNDFDRVCILVRTNHNGGVNTETGGYITAALSNEGLHALTPAAGGLGVDVQPEPVPTTPNIALTAAVAHEIAHSYGLNDEYGEPGKRQAKLSIPADLAKTLTASGNVQADSELHNAPNAPLTPNLIRWNWPRIKKAGILAERAGFVGRGTFQLKLKPGHASLFRKDDVVRLRGRNLLPSTAPGAPAPVGLSAYEMTIESIEAGDVLTVLISDQNAVPSEYPNDSLVVCTVRDSNKKDLSLIAPIMLNYLTKGPLNRASANPFPACTFDSDNKQTARNLPAGLPAGRPRLRNMIVGLWDGGATFHCGAYHPTGFCIMRARVDGGSIVGFCPVCRYVMVDALDPTKHGVIDDEYSKYYPQP